MTIRRERAATYLASPRAVSLHATFVANVKRIMRERGIVPAANGDVSITWLAEHADIPRRTIENILTLSNQPTMVGAAAIAQALGVPLDELCGLPPTWGYKDVPAGGTVHRQLHCIHTRKHLPHIPVCQSCLSKWQDYQRRLNELHHANRVATSQEADDALADKHPRD